MNAKHHISPRAETDASLYAERQSSDYHFARRVSIADDEADEVLRVARARADRLLAATRAAADARLPLSEQTKAAVALLLEERQREDRTVAAERQQADDALQLERQERRQALAAQLVLERHTTDLHLALERNSADSAVTSRDEFLALASHDLRGFMAAQKIYLSLLVKAAGANDHDRQLASHAAALVKIDAQMDRLVSDLVDVVAIDAGKLTVTREPDSAAELVWTAAAVFEPLAQERGQSLVVEPAASDVLVLVDRARAVQVLGNLLSNAIKFTPAGGTIRVGFEATLEDAVTFFVVDTGPGVPAEHEVHIFERFVCSKSARAGLGLGLFIAARVVDAHGGRIWLDRTGPAGSAFRFTLPRAN